MSRRPALAVAGAWTLSAAVCAAGVIADRPRLAGAAVFTIAVAGIAGALWEGRTSSEPRDPGSVARYAAARRRGRAVRTPSPDEFARMMDAAGAGDLDQLDGPS